MIGRWLQLRWARKIARRFGRGVLLLALLFLGITPQGFMPGVDDQGSATFVICTPEGVVERAVPGLFDPFREQPTNDRAAGLACPFAIISALAVTDYFGGVPDVTFASVDAPGLPRYLLAFRRLHDRPSVRAPPALFL